MSQADTVNCTPPAIRARQAEIEEIFTLFATLQEIEKAKVDMLQRLKSVPNGWRDIRMLESVLKSLIDRLLLTIPPEKLLSIKRTAPFMSYKVYFNRNVSTASVNEDATIVSTEDLDTLCHIVHRYECALCDENCNRCKVGKALDHVMVRQREKSESWGLIDIEEAE